MGDLKERFTGIEEVILNQEDHQIVLTKNLEAKNLEVLYKGTLKDLLEKPDCDDIIRKWLDVLYIHWMDYRAGECILTDIKESLKSAFEYLEVGDTEEVIVIER